MAQLVEIFPSSVDERKIDQLVERLRNGDILIIPTDSIYAIAGDLNHRKVLEKISKLVGKKGKQVKFSILCTGLSDLSFYSKPIPNSTYKLMNRLLPGPFTFILNASSQVPKIFRENKKTIGMRVPDNPIVQALIRRLGNPLVSTSIHSENEIQTYLTEIEEINQVWGDRVDVIVDGGTGGNIGTTVIDATSEDMVLQREGLGMELL